MSDFAGFFGFNFGLDYSDVIKVLNYKMRDSTGVRPVVLLFTPSYLQFVKDNILNLIDHLHFRSGDDIEFFCLGYEFTDKYHTKGGPFDDYGFDAAQFDSALKDFEERSSWTYSGESDVLIMNAVWNSTSKCVYLDLSAVIQITLERAIEEKIINSVPSFFEKLISIAKEYQGEDPTCRISDLFGLKTAGRRLYDFIMEKIPGNKGYRIDQAIIWRVRNLKPEEVDLLASKATDKDLESWNLPKESIEAIKESRLIK